MSIRQIKTTANRDLGTTWLEVEGIGGIIEVNPVELLGNALENQSDEIFQLFQVFMEYVNEAQEHEDPELFDRQPPNLADRMNNMILYFQHRGN